MISPEQIDFAQDVSYLISEPPPSYTAAISDAPPCYEILQSSIHNQGLVISSLDFWPVKEPSRPSGHSKLEAPAIPVHPMTPPSIDFNDTSTFRQAGKKANKKTQQKASQDKWADDDGDGTNPGGEGGDNTGGGNGGGTGGGGGSNNGDGGAGDDGGGDEWNFGGGKKKKKGKKGKNAIDEEEEQKEKEEEEKRKNEEGGLSGANDLSWMDDAVGKPDEEWAGVTSTDKKGKKNKKGKV